MSRLTVAALTLAVSTMTAAAFAQEPAAPPAPPAPEPAKATPLAVRPSKPIELAPPPSGSRYTTAIAAIAAVAAGGLWLYRRRSAGRSGAPRRTITISARKAIGVRSELLVVEVDGQGLLLGVTPGNIQRLAVLPDPALAEAPAEAEPEVDAEPGFRAAQQQAMRAPATIPPASRTREREPEPEIDADPEPRRPLIVAAIERKPRSRRDLPLEEQVRGLMRDRRPS
jgi:flagellar biogenesis protein FliO